MPMHALTLTSSGSQCAKLKWTSAAEGAPNRVSRIPYTSLARIAHDYMTGARVWVVMLGVVRSTRQGCTIEVIGVVLGQSAGTPRDLVGRWEVVLSAQQVHRVTLRGHRKSNERTGIVYICVGGGGGQLSKTVPSRS
jgi:hypothetical protein